MNRSLEDYQYINFFDACMDADKNLWLSDNAFNCLIKFHLPTGEAQEVGRFDGIYADDKEEHIKVVEVGDWLFFCSYITSGIHKYNRVTGEKACFKPGDGGQRCSYAKRFGHEIALFPTYAQDCLLIFDLEKEEFRACEWWRQKSRALCGEQNPPLFVYQERDDDVYAVFNENCLLRINVPCSAIEAERIEGERIHYFCVLEEGGFLIHTYENRIFVWEGGEKMKRYCDDLEVAAAGEMCIKLVGTDRHIAVLTEEHIILAEKNHLKPCALLKYPPGFFAPVGTRRTIWFYGFRVRGEEIFLFPQSANMMLRLHCREKRVEGIALRMPEKYDEEYVLENIVRQGIWQRCAAEAGIECRDFSLTQYLDRLLKEEIPHSGEMNRTAEEAEAGKRIWEAIHST